MYPRSAGVGLIRLNSKEQKGELIAKDSEEVDTASPSRRTASPPSCRCDGQGRYARDDRSHDRQDHGARDAGEVRALSVRRADGAWANEGCGRRAPRMSRSPTPPSSRLRASRWPTRSARASPWPRSSSASGRQGRDSVPHLDHAELPSSSSSPRATARSSPQCGFEGNTCAVEIGSRPVDGLTEPKPARTSRARTSRAMNRRARTSRDGRAGDDGAGHRQAREAEQAGEAEQARDGWR